MIKTHNYIPEYNGTIYLSDRLFYVHFSVTLGHQHQTTNINTQHGTYIPVSDIQQF